MLPNGTGCLCTIVLIGSVITVAFFALLQLYLTITCGKCKSKKKMEGKTVIVTGANSGIGKETALDLARRGARVIMACRTAETANKVRDEIISATGNQNVIVQTVDISNLQSVREFAKKILATERRLDVLIHNAGTAHMFGSKTTSDGLELTMATNYFGPFLLTHLLIDLIKQSAPSRIVVVASELYKLARLNLENINPVNGFPAYLYYVSKYADILFTKELARRLEGTRVTANCLHPGMINSGIWRNVPFPLNLPLKLIVKGFFKNPEQGAQTTIYAAVSEEMEGVSGKYLLDCKEHGLSSGAQDMAAAKKLWELTEEIVKLGPTDPRL